jgi:CheY-like chemotaxis protein
LVRILLADDNERMRSMLSELISQSDPDWQICAEAANGEAAFKKAVELKPDLVVLDFRMPVLDGYTAARHIRRILPRTPILLYTFLESPQLEKVAKDAGVNEVVHKADSRTLIDKIRRLALHPHQN